MDFERWRRIERIYYEALERGADGQAAFIDEACGADEELRHEVMTLLSAHERAGGSSPRRLLNLRPAPSPRAPFPRQAPQRSAITSFCRSSARVAWRKFIWRATHV